MDHSDPAERRVKKVVLPSGKTIEVVSMLTEQLLTERADTSTLAPCEIELHVCPDCDSDLAFPTAWAEAGEESWTVEIRCPECESRYEGVFAQDIVEAFDEALDAGADALIADYRRLLRANMADEVDRFSRALHAGAILPEDF